MIKIFKKFLCQNLTHVGENKMVNISNKYETLRYARASCYLLVNSKILELIEKNPNSKGDVLRISEIAGIMAAKKTSDLIPLCHQINLSSVNVKINLNMNENKINVETYVESTSKTGVEMEAMVSASITALTIYDMCKAVDKGIIISEIKLIEKFGGKSGHYIRKLE